jgi:polysaccharide export outer membrane protein
MKDVQLLTVGLAVALLSGCVSRNRSAANTAEQPQPSAPSLFHTTVVIVETNQGIYIDGEVGRPGRFIWSPGMTLTNAIALAGGFTDFAQVARVEIRHLNGSMEHYSYPRIVNGSTNNPTLNPNDRVRVPKRFF